MEREELELRDHLAIERTSLANHRTLLAYVRTAIVLVATGITLIKLFPDDPVLFIIGLVCIPLGIAGVIIGAAFSVHVKKKMASLYKDNKKGRELPRPE